MADRILELTHALTQTHETLEDLADRVEVQQGTLRRVRRTTALTIIGLILDISLTVLVGWGLNGVNDNQDRINQLTVALKTETDRNRSGQCAVVSLFLSLQPQVQKNPAYTPDQRATQQTAFTTLAQIGRTLECPQ